MLKGRSTDAQKGDYGEVLVVGGSPQYTNTPAIVALGALRAGCDLVRIAAPEESARIAAGFTLNVMPVMLDGSHFEAKHVERLVTLADRADCVAIGPGLGKSKPVRQAVVAFLERNDTPAIIDADALHAVGGRTDVVNPDHVLTPHAGEFHALTGEKPPENVDDRIELVEDYAGVHGCTILLKGKTDIISDGERTDTHETGNPYMAKGGTGDVLTGIAATFLTQDNDPFDSACAAAYFNGKAGDHALKTYGRGFLLEEMMQSVSVVMSPELEDN